MNHHRVRLGLIAAVALLAQTALAGPISAQDATPAAGAAVEQIAVVTPSSRTNQGWDQQAADAVEAVAAEHGIEAVVAENAGYSATPVAIRLSAQSLPPSPEFRSPSSRTRARSRPA
jgi:basic membrane lipoprotein Med (substrate-binding protein (PBP1-ABC) superfamily)